MNELNATKVSESVGKYRPKMTIYHPNGKCTGCALQLELHPAHDNHDGCIMAKVANQITVGNRNGTTSQTFARFDWENSISVKLDFNDLCKMLQVFRGECEAIEEGRGLYHRTVKGSTRIVLRHLVEPVQGYSLELYRVPSSGDGETHAHMLISAAEALGLCESIAGSMSVICFGIPMVIQHAVSVNCASEGKAVKNVSAA